jgi:hypothetical protein
MRRGLLLVTPTQVGAQLGQRTKTGAGDAPKVPRAIILILFHLTLDWIPACAHCVRVPAGRRDDDTRRRLALTPDLIRGKPNISPRQRRWAFPQNVRYCPEFFALSIVAERVPAGAQAVIVSL